MNSNQYKKNETPITAEQFEAICDDIESGTGVYNACKKVKCSTKSYYKYKETVDGAGKSHILAKKCKADFLLYQMEQNDISCHKEIFACEPSRAYSIQRYWEARNKRLMEIIKRLNVEEFGDKIDITSNQDSVSRSIAINPVSLANGNIDNRQPSK